jgi:aspartyl-tRNA synthetase
VERAVQSLKRLTAGEAFNSVVASTESVDCRRDIQARVFKLIGLTPEEAEAKFGYLLDCFEVGAIIHLCC